MSSVNGIPKALVFDFDGLVCDTEGPIYRAWCEQFEARGHTLALERWLLCVGTHDSGFDPVDELRSLVGEVDRATVVAAARARADELLAAEPCRPGVEALLDEAGAAGIPLGIASSSRRGWVEDHLERLGLSDRFATVAGRDDVGGRSKPAPDVYLHVLDALGVDGPDAVAIEDSAHGAAAAAAAGMRVVAVPNAVTAGMDLGAADVVLDTLEGVGLTRLVSLVGGA